MVAVCAGPARWMCTIGAGHLCEEEPMKPPLSEPCAIPRHRPSDWVRRLPDGTVQTLCGICHPRPPERSS